MSFNNEDFTESEETTETFSFYDRAKQQSVAPQGSTDFYSQAKQQETQTDTTSFYDRAKEQQQESEGLFEGAGRKLKDILTPKPPKEPIKNLLDPYRPEEKSLEELQAMTLKERREFVNDLNIYRAMQQARGLGKGIISGESLGASEAFIPALRPDEEDLMFGLGQIIGSYGPISLLYKVIGKPLVALALRSPIAKRALASLARMTGMGLTGATVTGIEEGFKGELPTSKELLKEGAKWFAIDAALQSMHLGVGFKQSIQNIARQEGVPAKDVLEKLWKSTSNFLKTKGRDLANPKNIKPKDVEELIKRTQQAEKEGLSSIIEVEVTPVETKPAEPAKAEKPKEPLKVEKPTVKEPEKPVEQPKPVVKEEKPPVEVPKPVVEEAKPIVPVEKLTDKELDDRIAKLDAIDEKANKFIPKTVEPNQEITIYRGSGRKDKDSVYGTFAEEPVLGKGQYYAFDPETAGKFGPNIEKKTLSFENPLVIDNDVDWRKITNRAGLKFPSVINIFDPKDTAKNVQKLNEFIKNEGYDAVVVKWKIPTTDDTARRLSKVFGDPQVFIPASAAKQIAKVDTARKPKEEPSRVEKQPPVEPVRGRKQPTIKMLPLKPKMGTRQAAKRSDIIKLFQKSFSDPLRIGKISKQLLGLHKGWPKVSRLLHANDIETAAHEIGHNLHYTLYGGDAKTPQQQRRNVFKHLRPYLDELKDLAQYEPYTLEGFAEFTRLYVTNPEVAKALAPKFYKKFENDLDANSPKLKNALIEARDYYDTYLQGTPLSRIEAQISFAQDKSRLNNIVEWAKGTFDLDTLKTQFLDDVFPAKRVVAEAFGIPLTEVENLKDPRNLYRALRVLKGAVGKGDVFLKYETFDPDTLDRVGEGLRQILNDLPNEKALRELNDYLVARRTIEKVGQQIETGITIEDAIAVHRDLKGKYDPLAKRLDRFSDTVLRYGLKSEVMSEDHYKQMKAKNIFYTPFQREMETPTKGIRVPTGRIQAAKPIKQMKGSTRDIISPVEGYIQNVYTIILNSEKNRAGKVLASLANMKNVGQWIERVPTPIHLKGKISKSEALEQIERNLRKQGVKGDRGFAASLEVMGLELQDIMPDFFLRFGAGTYPAGENIITVFDKGKPTFYEVSPDLYDMWNRGMAPYTSNLLTKILRMPARTLRAGAILNPKFIQKNFIRDTWGGWLFTKYGKTIKDPAGLFIDTIYQPLAMLGHAIKKTPLYVEWLKSGGGLSTMQSIDRDEVITQLAQVRKDFKPHQVIKMLRKAGEISEESNRLAEFSRALAVEGKTRLGREISAFASRDLSIDFAKMGVQTKALNQIIPFFNATIQGGDKLIRTMSDAKSRSEFLPRVIGFIVIPSLIFAWLNQDDEEINELQDQEKDFNFLTRIGNTILKIPVPFETGVIAHGLTQRLYKYFMLKDPYAFEGFFGSIRSAALPSFIPSFALPFIEAAANKNFFTGARIVPLPQEKLTSKYQYKTYTSVTARLLGRAMAYMLGQDTRSKAASPAIIDHFINSWGGGLGRLMVTISDASLKASGIAKLAGIDDSIPKPSQRFTEQLGLEAFIVRYPRAHTQSIEKFYDYYQDAVARRTSVDYAEKFELDTDDELDRAEKRIEHLYDFDDLKQAYDAMQMCQREINEIMIDPSISSGEKRIFVDDLYREMIAFAREAVADNRRHQKDQRK